MRGILLLLLLGAVICSASTILDPFHQDQSTCSFSSSPVCDVIGNEMLYDIQKAEVYLAANTLTATLFFNTSGINTSTMTLESFNDSGISNMMVGDLFFYDPSDPASAPKYGVPLISHGPFKAGDLYKIAGTVTTENARTALGDPGGVIYRPDQIVLMTSSGNPAAVSDGLPVSVSLNGNGTTEALYKVTVSFATDSTFLSTVLKNHLMGIMFASADCGNDYLQGAVDPVPEPQTLLLFAAGVCALAVFRRRRG